jgi:hypothetical protein
MNSMAGLSKKWNPDFLKQMSHQTDPECENIIGDIAKNQDFSSLRELFKSLNSNEETALNKNLPKSVIEYFNSNNHLPEWADEKKIKIAQDVFAQYGPEIALILNYKALPLCYSCKNGAKVLASTGRLSSQGEDTTKMMRRLLETSQMVINVMSEGGLSPNGAGIITVKKVRLYHAAIRYFLLNTHKGMEPWNTEYYGLPINQEEMAGTLMAFSALVINGLTQVGLQLTKEQKDAYMHTWNIVGHYIGLSPNLYPSSFEEGWELGIAIIKRNQEESEDGKFLVSSLVKNSQEYFFKGMLLNKIPEYLISFFIEDVSKAINVDLTKVIGLNEHLNFFEKLEGKLLLESMEIVNEIEDHVPVVRKLLSKNSTKHLQNLIQLHLQVNKVEFYIPDSLKANWNMN